jgi:hypothetical protein
MITIGIRGDRFTAALKRSWQARRAVNVGLLALSILGDDERRRLLDEWVNTGAGLGSRFASQADALLEFVARQLPDPSPELAVCRFEQLTLRAHNRARGFRAPDPALFHPQRVVHRAPAAGLVPLQGEADGILSVLRPPLEESMSARPTMALLVAPGLARLYRSASRAEQQLWARLAAPTQVATLVREGCASDSIKTLIEVGALEYVS